MPLDLAVQQIGQYHRIGYVGRRRHRRVDDLRLAIHPHVRLHPEVPLFALLRLVHLRIALLLPVLGRSGWVKRHLVRKRWTIEKADENSNGLPWSVLHRPNSDKLRFHLPSLPWHWFDA